MTDDPTLAADEVESLRRGWRLGEELLRPAQVVVTAAPETSEPWR